MGKSIIFFLGVIMTLNACSIGGAPSEKRQPLSPEAARGLEVAAFAGGCFWCTESDFEKIDGVKEVISGYMGGHVKNPTYEQVSSGLTGHRESVRVRFDPNQIPYDQLLEVFWTHINPTDEGGQFVDRGFQYSSAIFYYNDEQKRLAEESKKNLDESGRFENPVVTDIIPATEFYPAEDYHQDYHLTHPLKYKFYRSRSGRDDFIESVWGDEADEISGDNKDQADSDSSGPPETYQRPSDSEIKKMLTPLQYDVTQNEGTERPFQNEYWDNEREGIYVDIVSGEPLFSSKDKYESGTGWPSFTRPIDETGIVTQEDKKLFSTRTEARSKIADSHLGHVFEDGPQPTGLRYCMNSAALRFVPKEDLEQEGYGKYATLFK